MILIAAGCVVFKASMAGKVTSNLVDPGFRTAGQAMVQHDDLLGYRWSERAMHRDRRWNA